MPPEQALRNKAVIVNHFFPNMYVADKQSWYNAMYERMQQAYPSLLKFNNTQQKTFFASL